MAKLLSSRDVVDCAERLDVSVPALQAVIAVETAGGGFIDARLPKILFEGHVFHRLTDGRFDDERPDLSHGSWTRAHYRGGRGEYDRLLDAIALDADAALESCSWGLGQVMGFNFGLCGFRHIDAFVNAMAESEGRQLDAMGAFIVANGLDEALRAQDWEAFARRYNGPAYAANAYDTRLAAAFAKASRAIETDGSVPFVDDRARVAELQAALNAALGAGLVVDGWWGPKTRAAVLSWQRAEGLPATGDVDARVLCSLGLPENP